MFELTQLELNKVLLLASCRLGQFLGCLANDTILGTSKEKRDKTEKEIALYMGVIDALKRYEVGGTENCLTDQRAQEFVERLTIYTEFCIDDLQADKSLDTFFILTEGGGKLLQEDSNGLLWK